MGHSDPELKRSGRISSFFHPRDFSIREFLRFAQDSASGQQTPRNDGIREKPPSPYSNFRNTAFISAF